MFNLQNFHIDFIQQLVIITAKIVKVMVFEQATTFLIDFIVHFFILATIAIITLTVVIAIITLTIVIAITI